MEKLRVSLALDNFKYLKTYFAKWDPLWCSKFEGLCGHSLTSSLEWSNTQSAPEMSLQGDSSRSSKPPVDIKTKVPFWPGLARPCHAIHTAPEAEAGLIGVTSKNSSAM